jgi:esterase/lipase superfamily enzyme
MASTSERLEHILRALIREFAATPPKKLGREWLHTPFSELVPSARRRSVLFRRLRTAVPAIKAPVAELITDRFLTPGQLLHRFTGEIGYRSSRPAKKTAAAGVKKVAAKKAAVKKVAAKKAVVKKAAPRKAGAKKAAVKKTKSQKARAQKGQARRVVFRTAAVEAAVEKVAPSKSAEAARAGLVTEGKSAHSSVRVFYATDRKPLVKPTGVQYGSERQIGGELSYGTCIVSIPKKHKTGHLESPSYLRLEFRPNPDKHIALLETTTLDEDYFLKAVSESVAKSAAKDAFIFVHGYNVTFEDAARRTGQFAFDLRFIGAPILYSWPAKGRVRDYLADEANVIWTVPHFERFLGLIADRSGAMRIHVIAHSMGNRAVCDALKTLSSRRMGPNDVLLSHLVLAAPDIDAETFRELAVALKQMSNHVTLYASSRDKAIQASQKLHENPRAGAPPLVIVPGIESIDASGLGSDWLAHSYFSDNWPALSDIHALLSADTPAAERFGLMPNSDGHDTYFVFRV